MVAPAVEGIDLGTRGGKAALFAAEDAHLISSAFVDSPLLHPQSWWAEQHPADWWQATGATLGSCLASVGNLKPTEPLPQHKHAYEQAYVADRTLSPALKPIIKPTASVRSNHEKETPE
jgi:hypothetical protein